jgi:hypothetical protein
MKLFLLEKSAETTKQREEKKKNLMSPRNIRACHNTSIALLQSDRESI